MRRNGTTSPAERSPSIPRRRRSAVWPLETHYLDADGEGFATPEAAAEAVDRWLTTDRGLLGPRWALAPGGLPPRP